MSGLIPNQSGLCCKPHKPLINRHKPSKVAENADYAIFCEFFHFLAFYMGFRGPGGCSPWSIHIENFQNMSGLTPNQSGLCSNPHKPLINRHKPSKVAEKCKLCDFWRIFSFFSVLHGVFGTWWVFTMVHQH